MSSGPTTSTSPVCAPHAVAGTVQIASAKVSVAAVAWAISGLLHAGVFTAAYYADWSHSPASRPQARFAAGEQADWFRVKLLPAVEVISPRDLDELRPADPVSTILDIEPAPRVVPIESSVQPALPAGALERIRSVEPLARWIADDDPIAIDTPDAPRASADRQSPSQEVARADGAGVSPVKPPAEHRPSAPAAKRPGVKTGVRVVDLPRPEYPRVSRNRGEEGVVLLEIEVRADGTVGAVHVAEDPGFPRLVSAAIAAAHKANFKPATRDGKPVPETVRIPFRFSLR